jgi:hypothetical protein
MDETPRTASCREGTEETAISTSGMGRRHPGTIVTFCRRSAQERTMGGRRILVSSSCCASCRTWCTRIPDMHLIVTIVQSQMLGSRPRLTDDDDNKSTPSSPGHRHFHLWPSSWSTWTAKIPSKLFLTSKSNQVASVLVRKGKRKDLLQSMIYWQATR